MSARTLQIPEGLDGERLDVALSRFIGLSRTKIAELIDRGLITVNGDVVAKSQRLSTGDSVEIVEGGLDAPAVAAVEQSSLTVIFEDDDIIVIDKPVGVAVHPSPGWTGATVVQSLAASGHRISTSGAAERQGVVHRLDAGTSGVMVVAKSEQAYSALKSAFKERTVDKVYHALVQGHPDPSRGTVDAPIDRHPTSDWRFAIIAGGKPSITHYEVLEAFPGASLVRVELETGRTHQIRVHMSALHHPCVGDLTYGADPTFADRLGLERQWLHAVELGFSHPRSGEHVRFQSSYPSDLQGALDHLRAIQY
jgi:23S rRNA pseudouridine1911/1915/1917 synthase